MPYEFRLPDIGEGVAEGEVVQWFVKEGDTIAEDAPLVSVLTDKANVEIPSPKAGKVVKIFVAVGEKVKVGGTLVSIEVAGSSTPAAAPTAAPTVPAASPGPAPGAAAPAAPPATSPPNSGARALASPSVRRLAGEKGIDLASIRGSGPGGRILESDLISGAPPTSPGESTAAPSAASPPTVAPAVPAAATPAPGAPPVAPAPEVQGVQRIPIRGLRRAIAEHMSRSVHTAAHFTYVEEIDATELVQMRERMAKHVEKEGVKLTYLPFLIKAVVAGLRAHPWMNATMDDERQELVVHAEYNIGIATAGPDGLIVPVLKNVAHKSFSSLAKEIQGLSERGRAGKLTRPELTGGTFTITSLGALGGVLATPILNYPEVGIMGVHRIVRRPVYRSDGSIGPADLMNLSVSLDHRVLDGIVGAQFLSVVKANLEDPHRLFADLA